MTITMIPVIVVAKGNGLLLIAVFVLQKQRPTFSMHEIVLGWVNKTNDKRIFLCWNTTNTSDAREQLKLYVLVLFLCFVVLQEIKSTSAFKNKRLRS